jgi:cell division protein FtsL
MGQAAYDMNAVRRRKAPQTQRKADLRVAKGGKRRLSPLQAAVHNAMHLVAAGFAISLLWSESRLVELNDQIQDAKAQLVSEQSQYTYYNSTLNSKTNITSVEETANRLGLMKIDQSQITYIRLGESDTLERTQSAVRQWTDFIYNGAVTILGTIQ